MKREKKLHTDILDATEYFFLWLQTAITGRLCPPCGCEIFVGIAAWLATHYWMHWEFSMDRDFLINRAYPFFKLIAEFYEDFLCEDPDGNLQIAPSQSPENNFVESGNAPSVSVCVSSAIDIQLCQAVFDWVIYISDTFGVDRKACKMD